MDELEQLKAQLAELMADKQSALAAKEQEAKAAKRSGFMSKFGGMFDNDDEIGDMLIGSIDDAGGDIESVTQEAIAEYLLKPVAEWAQKLLSKIGKAITTKVEEVMEGTVPSEGAPAAPPQVDLPEDVGAEPLMNMPDAGAAPAGAGGALPTDAAAGLSPMGTAAPLPSDMGGAPPALPPDPNAQPILTSDARYKNIRGVVLSDERFKSIEPELSDSRLKAIEMLSSVKELSDEDLKDIIFMDKPTTPKASEAPTPSPVVTSDVNEKNVAKPALSGLFADMMDIDPETGNKITSDVNAKVVEPVKSKPEVDFSKLTPNKPIDETDAVMKDLSDFGLKNIMGILGRTW